MALLFVLVGCAATRPAKAPEPELALVLTRTTKEPYELVRDPGFVVCLVNRSSSPVALSPPRRTDGEIVPETRRSGSPFSPAPLDGGSWKSREGTRREAPQPLAPGAETKLDAITWSPIWDLSGAEEVRYRAHVWIDGRELVSNPVTLAVAHPLVLSITWKGQPLPGPRREELVLADLMELRVENREDHEASVKVRRVDLDLRGEGLLGTPDHYRVIAWPNEAPISIPPHAARDVVGRAAVEAIVSSSFVLGSVRVRVRTEDDRLLESAWTGTSR